MTWRDALAVADARLIDPAGTAYPAAKIERDRTSYRSDEGLQPSVGAGVAGGSGGWMSSGVGIGLSIPLFSGGGAQDEVTESRVTFRLPDPAAYRASWQRWKIHLDLAGDGTGRSIDLPAPAPPKE